MVCPHQAIPGSQEDEGQEGRDAEVTLTVGHVKGALVLRSERLVNFNT